MDGFEEIGSEFVVRLIGRQIQLIEAKGKKNNQSVINL